MIVYHSDDVSTPIGGGPIGETSPPPPPPPADSPSSAPIGGAHSRRVRWAPALGAVLILATLLACDAGPDGSCRAPTPCGQNQGANP